MIKLWAMKVLLPESKKSVIWMSVRSATLQSFMEDSRVSSAKQYHSPVGSSQPEWL